MKETQPIRFTIVFCSVEDPASFFTVFTWKSGLLKRSRLAELKEKKTDCLPENLGCQLNLD